MDFTLTEEQELLRNEARDFLSQEWPSSAMRRMLDDPGPATDKFWVKIAELGWPGLIIPEEFQGLAAETLELAVIMEEMGRRLVPGTFFSTAVLTPAVLAKLGTSEAKQEHLPAITEGRIRATTAVFEADSEWDVNSLAPPDSQTRLVKRFVPDAVSADVVFCAVRQGDDVVQLLIPEQADITSLGVLDVTRDLCEVAFMPARARVVGEGSLADLQSALDFATIALAAEMIGSAAQALDVTVEYVKTREQFGRPVGSFQAVQQRAADMLIAVEEARSLTQHAAIVADEQPDRLTRSASIAKVAANRALRFVSQYAIQLHGGIGFTWEQDLHLYLKRAKSAEFTLGSTDWHLDRIATDLGIGQSAV